MKYLFYSLLQSLVISSLAWAGSTGVQFDLQPVKLSVFTSDGKPLPGINFNFVVTGDKKIFSFFGEHYEFSSLYTKTLTTDQNGRAVSPTVNINDNSFINGEAQIRIDGINSLSCDKKVQDEILNRAQILMTANEETFPDDSMTIQSGWENKLDQVDFLASELKFKIPLTLNQFNLKVQQAKSNCK